MHGRFKQLIESYQRVQDFLGANPPPQPPPAYAAQKKALDDSVARLAVLASNESAGRKESRGETQRQRAVRGVLRENHLEPISRLGKALFDNPELQKSLSMPSAKLLSTRLIAEAKGMRDTVASYAQQFVAHGRPQDFLAQLDAAIDALRQAMLRRAATRGKHVGAKKGLKQELQTTRRAVSLLDAQVRTVFRGNAELLAKWRTAKRVQLTPGGGRPPSSDAVPPVQSAA